MAKITIYKNANFQNGVDLYEGHYNSNRLNKLGLHDAISSVRIPPGMAIILYKNANWQGESLKLVTDNSRLPAAWNDCVSSLEVTSAEKVARATFYEHTNYQGDQMLLGSGSYQNLESGIGNDLVSSVRVPPGFLVVLFEHVNFKGRVYGLTTDAKDLAGFNDLASSIRVYQDSQYENQLRPASDLLPVIPKLTGHDITKIPTSTESALIGEVLLPFIFVKDTQNIPYIQATQSPYYKLSREVSWENVSSFHHAGNTKYTYTKIVKTGMSESETQSVKKTLCVEITASGGLTFKIGDVGIDSKISTKVAETLETTWSQTQTQMSEKEVEIKYEFPEKETTLAIWMRRDTYTLKRLDEYPLTTWSFLNEDFNETQGYPPAKEDDQTIRLATRIHQLK